MQNQSRIHRTVVAAVAIAWALFQLAGLTLLAYVVTLVVYQVGSLAGVGVG